MPSAASPDDLAGAGMEDVYAVGLHLDPPGFGIFAGRGQDLDVGLPEDDEQVALPGVRQVPGHVQIRVHAGLEHRQRAELVALGAVWLEVERSRD